MHKDKFSATWVSHSSISDYLNCPRSYYLKNVYKDSTSGNKIQITSPALSLGCAVHEVLEGLSVVPTKDRFKENLIDKFEKTWQQNYTGKQGGFLSESLEKDYVERGKKMLKRAIENPGPLAELAVKIKGELPNYYLSDEDDIILCGKIDWLQYDQANNSVHIIDFKTSKKEESGDSLQLPIYHLLVKNCQKYDVSGASYWYLDFSDELIEKELPDLETAKEQVLEIAKKIKLARKLKTFKCQHDGCQFCEPFEKIVKGEGEIVKHDLKMRRDIYILPWDSAGDNEVIL
jgi:ATP-dependent helicase/DNAse subunit B